MGRGENEPVTFLTVRAGEGEVWRASERLLPAQPESRIRKATSHVRKP